jgi:uncharacterized protein (TIGR02757 family)
LKTIKELLDFEVDRRNRADEVSEEKPDPILIAREYMDEKVALFAALFAYGNVKSILKFLKSVDFESWRCDCYYRFQKTSDVQLFLDILKSTPDLESIYLSGYNSCDEVYPTICGIRSLINHFSVQNPSRGYKFLIGTPPPKGRYIGVSPYKRWNLFLRWMVRKDNIDLGLWKNVSAKHLIVPLDTHLFNISRRLGLLNRARYDLQAAIELTENLRRFDSLDPLKYDFAIYRIGQERIEVEKR